MALNTKLLKKFQKKDYSSFILGADIGGTNANFGVFGARKGKVEQLLYFHFESKKLPSAYSAVNEILRYLEKDYGVHVSRGCFGLAGALSPKRDYVHLTNANLDVSKKELIRKTRLKNVFLMNDFEALGYGINALRKSDFKIIKPGQKIAKAPIAVIGAGTGLGKTSLFYDHNFKMYVPFASETHHADFPAQNKEELELVEFIKKYRKNHINVSNGDVLSGEGIENIYMFLRNRKKFRQTKAAKEIDSSDEKPQTISKFRGTDPACRKTFEIFRTAYSKFAKDVALDTLSYGGVYIAGGIGPKNREIFDKEFVKIFSESRKMHNVLRKIPIYLILDYNLGLRGAGFAGARLTF